MRSEGRIGLQWKRVEKLRKEGESQCKISGIKIARMKPTNGVKPRPDVVFRGRAVGKQEGSYGNFREGLNDAH